MCSSIEGAPLSLGLPPLSVWLFRSFNNRVRGAAYPRRGNCSSGSGLSEIGTTVNYAQGHCAVKVHSHPHPVAIVGLDHP